MYSISATTLNAMRGGRFDCERCFYLKVKHDVRPPQMEGLHAILNRIHDYFFGYLKDNWIESFPAGRLIATELHVRSKEINGISLHGFVDGLIELESGSYAVIDLKTTQSLDWIVKNYAQQVNVYAYCLEHPAEDSPAYPVDRLAIISFSDTDFAIRTPQNCGVRGELCWHEVRKDYRMVGAAVGRALDLLSSGELPEQGAHCEWCQFYEKYGIEWEARSQVTGTGCEMARLPG